MTDLTAASPKAQEHLEWARVDRRSHGDAGCQCPLCELAASLTALSWEMCPQDGKRLRDGLGTTDA